MALSGFTTPVTFFGSSFRLAEATVGVARRPAKPRPSTATDRTAERRMRRTIRVPQVGAGRPRRVNPVGLLGPSSGHRLFPLTRGKCPDRGTGRHGFRGLFPLFEALAR